MVEIDEIKAAIRDVQDYPRRGIVFKDITPLLANPQMLKAAIQLMMVPLLGKKVDAIAGIEARGFILGPILAHELGCSFIPVRKAGRLPFKARRQQYNLEYGSAEIEMHDDAVKEGSRVVVHDDLLATGGTATAAAKLIESFGGELVGFSFLINLGFLPGAKILEAQFGVPPDFVITY